MLKDLNYKVWIPAIILMTALITAIVVTLLLQGRLQQLNVEVSDLKSLLAAERETNNEVKLENEAAQLKNEALSTENKTLKADNESLSAEKEALSEEIKTADAEIETLRQYQLSFDIPYGFEIAIDQRLDPKLIDMIKKHFNAIADGSKNIYRETLANPKNDYLLEIFEARKHTKTEITSIAAYLDAQDRFQNGGFYLTVSFKKDGQINFYDIGVTKKNGKWVVYDYD
mgnify:CR=1 FL=1